ncbi:hypothetical protein [Streptomyces synnematoformans]|uniref:Minor tail protein n=1 Tax=Streptomyces synnematoformans TaxID=415721 RepID=A0ABN2XM62_9ACTN
MADITKIVARILTADIAEAKTDSGTLYLGIAGREFVLETPANDLEQGATDEFVLGDGANVDQAVYNDPRKPQLTTEDLDRYPAYLRYLGTDGWCLERATVTVNPGDDSHVFDNLDLQGLGEERRIWLRNDYGQQVGLRRTAGRSSAGSGQGGGTTVGRRLVFGNVDAEGNAVSGSGDFWVTRESTGRYAIVFQNAFTTLPSVTSNIWGDGWYTLDNTQAAVIETGRIVIVTGNSNGQYSNRGFSFQVVG